MKKIISILSEDQKLRLFDANQYEGYNCIYWLEQGFDEWLKDGCPDFPEKQQYIEGNEHQFNRYYY